MKRLVILLFGVGFMAAASAATRDVDFERYKALNEAETRLQDFKDDDAALRLKIEMLGVVNASRAKYKAKPLELDILASRVANKQSREGAEKGFTGHWNSAGEKPYHRYAFAGGTDHVSENAGAMWSSGTLDPSMLFEYMKQIHAGFMAEPLGADGHKKNIINQVHTHVGLGVALAGKQFRYYEEYLDRYLDAVDAPSEAAVDSSVTIRFKPKEGFWPLSLVAYYEPLPKPLTVAALNAKGAYPDFSDSRSFQKWAPFERGEDGFYVVDAVGFEKPGLYYIQLYLDTKDPSGSSSLSTAGKVQASGIVVKVPR